jgi:serine/threonine-protein kinase RsbW
MHEVLIADLDAPSRVRHALDSWLRELPLTRSERHDLLLATSEAVANVVDHAYPADHEGGEVTVAAKLQHRSGDDTGRVVVTVTDSGCWRPAPGERDDRGRGLQLMRACTDSLDIETTTAGTRVTMVSGPVRAS